MKFYLSSYKLGNKINELKKMIPRNNKCAYIPNALDFTKDLKRRKESESRDIEQLKEVGLIVELVDLRDYFNNKRSLEEKLKEFGVIWVRGGNVFVLRQAMKLSGFDEILKKLSKEKNILYGGYSAGVCILSPSLRGIELIDNINQKPYSELKSTIWEGLGLIDYSVAPHYKSNHPDSENTDKAVDYFKKNKIKYKAIKDGEVIIIN